MMYPHYTTRQLRTAPQKPLTTYIYTTRSIYILNLLCSKHNSLSRHIHLTCLSSYRNTHNVNLPFVFLRRICARMCHVFTKKTPNHHHHHCQVQLVIPRVITGKKIISSIPHKKIRNIASLY